MSHAVVDSPRRSITGRRKFSRLERTCFLLASPLRSMHRVQSCWLVAVPVRCTVLIFPTPNANQTERRIPSGQKKKLERTWNEDAAHATLTPPTAGAQKAPRAMPTPSQPGPVRQLPHCHSTLGYALPLSFVRSFVRRHLLWRFKMRPALSGSVWGPRMECDLTTLLRKALAGM